MPNAIVADSPAVGRATVATPASAPPLENVDQTFVARLIDRYRWVIFGFCLLVLLIGFNGYWRIGFDSAQYRGLADSLARGRGYVFGEFATTTAYPGLPVLLAAVQKFIGHNVLRPWPSVLMILSMGLLTLAVVYGLIRLHYPRWVATTITAGVALNAKFVSLSHQLLTDIPFMLGLVSSLYGWELMRAVGSRGRFWRGFTVAALGLCLAAAMRPTFWILALVWIGVGVYELIRKRHVRANVASLCLILCVVALVSALDPRTRTRRLFDGGYEREFLSILADGGAHVDTRAPGLVEKIKYNLPKLVHENFPEAFLGIEFPLGGNEFVTVVLLAAAVVMIRRHALWGWLVVATVAVTLTLSTTPRYYLMVLPFLLLGWLHYCNWLRFGSTGWWGNLVMVYGLGFVTLMNLARITPFVIEQRSTPFYQHYADGECLRYFAIAEKLREIVPPKDRVVGPQASVLSFLSGRKVLMQRELLPPTKSARLYADMMAASNVKWGIFPAGPYKDNDPDIGRMIDRRVIRKKQVFAEADGLILATIEVVLPPEGTDWRQLPLSNELLAQAEARRLAAERRLARERKEAQARKEDRERKAALARKIKRQQREAARQAATQPATRPKAQPATQPGAFRWSPFWRLDLEELERINAQRSTSNFQRSDLESDRAPCGV